MFLYWCQFYETNPDGLPTLVKEDEAETIEEARAACAEWVRPDGVPHQPRVPVAGERRTVPLAFGMSLSMPTVAEVESSKRLAAWVPKPRGFYTAAYGAKK